MEAIDEVHRRVRYGCKSDLLGLVSLRGVGRVRAREMAKLLGVSEASDIAELTGKRHLYAFRSQRLEPQTCGESGPNSQSRGEASCTVISSMRIFTVN